MFSIENIRFSASYPNFIKLKYIFYTVTLDYKKKIQMQQNGRFLKKKLKFCSKI